MSDNSIYRWEDVTYGLPNMMKITFETDGGIVYNGNYSKSSNTWYAYNHSEPIKNVRKFLVKVEADQELLASFCDDLNEEKGNIDKLKSKYTLIKNT